MHYQKQTILLQCRRAWDAWGEFSSVFGTTVLFIPYAEGSWWVGGRAGLAMAVFPVLVSGFRYVFIIFDFILSPNISMEERGWVNGT